MERFFAPDGGPALIDPVQVYFAYDDRQRLRGRHLPRSSDRLAAKAESPSATARSTTRTASASSSSPCCAAARVYQIYVNPLGTVFDQKIEAQAGGAYTADKSWNGEYEVRTQRSPFAWTVEMRIPLAQFEARTAKNQPWRINFRRKQPRVGSLGRLAGADRLRPGHVRIPAVQVVASRARTGAPSRTAADRLKDGVEQLGRLQPASSGPRQTPSMRQRADILDPRSWR